MLIVMVITVDNCCSKWWYSAHTHYTLTGAFTSNENSGVFANLPAGNYVIGVEDANNCTKTINETITRLLHFLILFLQ